jgi:uncharacterized membrane protein
MPNLSLKGLKTLKLFHILTASLWVGGAVALNLVNILLPGGESGGEILGHNTAGKLIDDMVIIPGAIGCILTGLLYSLFSNWGFFKHRWLLLKWILTVSCVLFGTFFLGPRINGLPPISHDLGLAALSDPVYLSSVKSLLVGGLIQLAVLIFMLYLSVFKPKKSKAGQAADSQGKGTGADSQS